ncbi:SpoIIE family protein phosphatase [Armatimonas sp.]|uniref:SpoIIE family protein phosphatase n=1 Tax=Armatimonas sp. TaxID=1872638 RepID=UPI00374DE306
MFSFAALPNYSVALRRASYREASEDRAVTVTTFTESLVLAVAGGVVGGGEAASLAIETVEFEAEKLARKGKRLWRGFFRALDDALVAHPDAGQTTLVALCLTSQKIIGASVGSSEAWWITADGHFDLTEAQKRKPTLGSGSAEPVPFELKLSGPGTLLLASDGLFKYADPIAITEAARSAVSADVAADALLALASAPAGRFYDDVALIVVRVETKSVRDTIALWTRFLHRFKAG